MELTQEDLREWTELATDIGKWVFITILVPGLGFVRKLVLKYLATKKEESTYRSTMLSSHETLTKTLSSMTDTLSVVRKDVADLKLMHEAQFEISPIPLFICDNQGLCVAANEALIRIFKSTEDEMFGHGWLNHIHPEDKSRVRSSWDEAIEVKALKIRDSYRVIDRSTAHHRRPTVVAEVGYKTIFKFDSANKLEVAVGTVWHLGSLETSEEKLDCILRTITDVKRTPTWLKIQEEINERKS